MMNDLYTIVHHYNRQYDTLYKFSLNEMTYYWIYCQIISPTYKNARIQDFQITFRGLWMNSVLQQGTLHPEIAFPNIEKTMPHAIICFTEVEKKNEFIV